MTTTPSSGTRSPGLRRRADAAAQVNTVTVGVFSWAMLEPEKDGTRSAGWTRHSTGCTATASGSSWRRPPRHRRPGSPWPTPTRCPVTRDGLPALARQPGHLLRRRARLPGGGPADRRPNWPGGTPRTRARHVARAQRVRHDVLVRPCGGRVPQLAARAVTGRLGGLNDGVGHGVLEPAVLRVGAGSAAAGDTVPAEPGAEAGLPAVLVGRTAGRVLPSNGTTSAARSGRPGDHELHGARHLVIDPWAWGREVDMVAVDHYLSPPRGPDGAADIAFVADRARGLGGGRPWLLMEQAASMVNTRHGC